MQNLIFAERIRTALGHHATRPQRSRPMGKHRRQPEHLDKATAPELARGEQFAARLRAALGEPA